MPDPITISEHDFEIVSSLEKREGKPQPETPFRMLVMADFSARLKPAASGPAAAPPGKPRPVRVDRDTLDAVFARMGVEIALPILGKNNAPVRIRFSELDDFHPDSIYRRVDVFKELRDTRESLRDPAVFAAFAETLHPEPRRDEKMPPPPGPPIPGGGGLLDQIIEQESGQPSSRPASPQSRSELDSFVRDIVRPHLLRADHPKAREAIGAVDAAAAELLRMIISHPRFQQTEAAWRGLNFLLSRLETDDMLAVYLLDMTKEELGADLAGVSDPRKSALYRVLVEETVRTPGGEPWAVVAGCYTMRETLADVGLLARMAQVAQAAGAPFIAAASDTMLCAEALYRTPDPDDWQPWAEPEAREAWQLLRQLPEASSLGLVLPRFLLRLPYGADTEPLDTMNFEELGEEDEHENYLWGNPALIGALLLGQAFSQQGWRMEPGAVAEIDSLPLHIYSREGERRTMPCAEAMLSHRAAERILDAGLMPLLSFLNQDMVRLARFQSLAEPPTRLAGPWS
ncbi:MAG: type VI secretion system contractile sheath large subunit [Deltaproteobacteria bacterium]|nr:type VI secretion system contractile sheath large subunit [Deltaproteobacteria bacterium]